MSRRVPMTMLRPRRTVGVAALAVLSSVACATHGVGQPAEPALPVHAGEIDHSLFLIGDAGHALAGDRTMTRVTELMRELGDKATVVFLGDNVYPAGLPAEDDPYRATAEAILEVQLDVARRSGGRGIIIPGNHDWGHGGDDGWDAIRRQEQFVERDGANLFFLPDGGCPGPQFVDLGARLRLIAVDTQWWLQQGRKPMHPDSPCLADAPDEVVASLRSAVGSAGDRRAVVVGHHPLASVGKHGGYFPLEDHVFPLRRVAKWLWIPLPFIGSAYPALRNLGVYEQDVSSGRYRDMVQAMNSAFRPDPPLVYAAAHDHSLQVLEGESARFVLVSGSGPSSGLGAVGWNDRTLFARKAFGFMRLDVLRTGAVRLGVYEAGPERGFHEAYARWLAEPPPQ